jgi:hypothetical protein
MTTLGTQWTYTLQYRDGHGRLASLRLYAPPLTGANYDTILGYLDQMKTSLSGQTKGVVARAVVSKEVVISNALSPDGDRCSVHKQVLVRCRGTVTGKLFAFRIPTADFSRMNFADPPNGNAVIIKGPGAHAATVGFVNQLQALMRMPNNPTEGLIVVSMEVVE